MMEDEDCRDPPKIPFECSWNSAIKLSVIRLINEIFIPISYFQFPISN